MRPVLIMLFLALALVAGAPRRTSVTATATPPTAFLSGTFCPDTYPAAMFMIPGTEETAEILAARGVSGQVDAIWIDLSLFDNGYAAGTFLSIGPFTPKQYGAAYHEWRGLLRESTHFYRLNAHVGDRWLEFGRGTFRTNNCIVLRDVLCAEDGTAFANFEPLKPGILEHGGLPTETWIDLSLFDNGFVAATFVHVGPFAPTSGGAGVRAPFLWTGLLPNRTHFYRENTLYTGAGWLPQYAGAFVTPDCGGLPKLLPGGVG